jgi:hypothetical protein
MTNMVTDPTTEQINAPITLQGIVLISALDCTSFPRFHNLQIWLIIYTKFNINLSYKQIRDALFRLRNYYCIRHIGRGWYVYDIQ